MQKQEFEHIFQTLLLAVATFHNLYCIIFLPRTSLPIFINRKYVNFFIIFFRLLLS